VIIISIILAITTLSSTLQLNPLTLSSSEYSYRTYILNSNDIAYKTLDGSIKYLSSVDYENDLNPQQQVISNGKMKLLSQDDTGPYNFLGLKIIDDTEFYLYGSYSRSFYGLYLNSNTDKITIYTTRSPVKTISNSISEILSSLNGRNYSYRLSDTSYLTVYFSEEPNLDNLSKVNFYYTDTLTEPKGYILASKYYSTNSSTYSSYNNSYHTMTIYPSYYQLPSSKTLIHNIVLSVSNRVNDTLPPFGVYVENTELDLVSLDFEPYQESIQVNTNAGYVYLFEYGTGSSNLSISGLNSYSYVEGSIYLMQVYLVDLLTSIGVIIDNSTIVLNYVNDNIEIIRIINKSTEVIAVRPLQGSPTLTLNTQSLGATIGSTQLSYIVQNGLLKPQYFNKVAIVNGSSKVIKNVSLTYNSTSQEYTFTLEDDTNSPWTISENQVNVSSNRFRLNLGSSSLLNTITLEIDPWGIPSIISTNGSYVYIV
jgi:hypothetical protein